jgi:hypothetical protein
VHQPFALHAFLEVAKLVLTDNIVGNQDVIERLLIHEMREMPVGIGELNRPTLQPDVGNPFA